MYIYIYDYVCMLLQPVFGLCCISCWDQMQHMTFTRIGNTKRVCPGSVSKEYPACTNSDGTGKQAGEAAALYPFASFCWCCCSFHLSRF